MVPIRGLDRRLVTQTVAFGLSVHDLANFAFAAAYLAILAATALRRVPAMNDVQLVTGALAASFAIYMIPTRVHERYFFPALVLAILVAALRQFDRPGKTIMLLSSFSFALNLAAVYWSELEPVFIVLPFINVVTFSLVLAVFVSPERFHSAIRTASSTAE